MIDREALEKRCQEFLLNDNKKARTVVIAAREFADFVLKEIGLATPVSPASGAVQDAFKPFADFMAGGSFDKIPDDMPLTAGSSIARRQITAGHFRKLAAAITGPGGEL